MELQLGLNGDLIVRELQSTYLALYSFVAFIRFYALRRLPLLVATSRVHHALYVYDKPESVM